MPSGPAGMGTDHEKRARSRTVTAAVAVTSSTVTVIVVVPSPTLVTAPFSTVATLGSEDDHANRPGAEGTGSPSSAKVRPEKPAVVPRIPMIRSAGSMRTEETGG